MEVALIVFIITKMPCIAFEKHYISDRNLICFTNMVSFLYMTKQLSDRDNTVLFCSSQLYPMT